MYKLRIEQDPYNDLNPRNDDNLGTVVSFQSKYDLGDKQERDLGVWLSYVLQELYPERDSDNWYDFCDTVYNGSELGKARQLLEAKAIVLPVYAYIHGGITISTGPFTCVWDSGQIGFIYVPIEDVKKEWGWNRLTAKRRAKIEDILRAEITTYNQYLTGDVWGFVVEDSEGNHVDSCWGFYGREHCEAEGNDQLKYWNSLPEID